MFEHMVRVMTFSDGIADRTVHRSYSYNIFDASLRRLIYYLVYAKNCAYHLH